MSSDLPAPLVDADVNLRGMEFMLLFGDRLFKSTTWIQATPEARCAALQLWWHAFAHEQPAASLPDNERLLAEYAGLGGSIRTWRRVRDQAMRGWIKCNDGRWYHAVVAELAKEAWAGRVRNREKVRKFREKREGIRPEGMADVTVTETVTTPLGNRRESESKGQTQSKTQGQTTHHDAPSAPTRGTRLPDDWQPDEDLNAEVHQFPGANAVDFTGELAKFRDYWTAKTRDATKLDWRATFRNWIREAIRRATNGQANRPNGFGQAFHNTSIGRKASMAMAFMDLQRRGSHNETDAFDEGDEPEQEQE